MGSSPETVSMAMFCDFENVALGVRDANYEKFDIEPVLERLLLKGSIVLKKAYCDWERYKAFKATMHEANFELIEIPHLRQSGKNSADIRMVVDALDLCYTKAHVNTFVIVSGDSDFSPLVSKLRENAKYVIGVGVKQSTSDLLIANCDEFIFYDDLVRESQRKAARRDPKAAPPVNKHTPEELEAKRSKVIELALETLDALVAERGDTGKIWASMLKEAIKRRKPDFNESYYGFKSFGNLLEGAQSRGLIELGKDEKSGTFVTRACVTTTLPKEVIMAAPDSEESPPNTIAEPAEKKAKAAPQKRREHREKQPPKKASVTPETPETAPPLVTEPTLLADAAPPTAEASPLPEKQSTLDAVAPEKKPARNRARKPKAPAAEAKATNADEVPVA